MSAIDYAPEALESGVLPRTDGVPAESPIAAATRIATLYGATMDEVRKPGHASKRIMLARRAIYKMLRARGWSWPDIGQFCGKHESTVRGAFR